MEPSFVTPAAGRSGIRLVVVLCIATLPALGIASLAPHDWGIAAAGLFTVIFTLGLEILFGPLAFEVHSDRIEVRYIGRRSRINLAKVRAARPGRWWEIYTRFLSGHYETDVGHLVVLDKFTPSLLDRGWLLSPQDLDAFVSAVNSAIARQRS